MQRENVRVIVEYYKNIPGMLRYEYQERERVEDEFYNGLKSAGGGDGMPHGAGVGQPTEKMGIRAAEKNAADMLKRSHEHIKILEADEETIRCCIEGMNGKYKKLIFWKLINEYSWAKISTRFERPDSTCRYWLDIALDRLGEILEKDVKELSDLEKRASRAR